jgi:hypothetical protein
MYVSLFLSLFDRLLLSTSVESNETNLTYNKKKIFFSSFFHRLLCHLTRKAVGPTIEERKRKEKKKKKRQEEQQQ